MSKAKQNRILNSLVLGVILLLVLGLGATIVLMPIEADAEERAGYYQPYSNRFNNPYHDPLDNTLTGNPANAPSSATSNTSGSVLGASTSKSNAGSTSTAKTEEVSETKEKKEFKELTANTLFGGEGFLPNSILQWILLAILVLIIVILARKFFGLDEKFQETPLKHS